MYPSSGQKKDRKRGPRWRGGGGLSLPRGELLRGSKNKGIIDQGRHLNRWAHTHGRTHHRHKLSCPVIEDKRSKKHTHGKRGKLDNVRNAIVVREGVKGGRRGRVGWFLKGSRDGRGGRGPEWTVQHRQVGRESKRKKDAAKRNAIDRYFVVPGRPTRERGGLKHSFRQEAGEAGEKGCIGK